MIAKILFPSIHRRHTLMTKGGSSGGADDFFRDDDHERFPKNQSSLPRLT
jgi:hypothetical protein